MRKTIINRAFVGVILISCISCTGDSATNLNPPNIVIFLVDDLGWMDVGYQGSTFYETPNIDALASRGMKFAQSYAAHPRCVPSRYALMTGKYPARIHLPGAGNGLPASDLSMATAFQKEGYRTFFAGKWHLSKNGVFPENAGFDINYAGGDSGAPRSHFYPYNVRKMGKGSHLPPSINRLPEAKEDNYYLADQLTDLTVTFIKESKDDLFFVYLSHYGVHTPLESKVENKKYYEQKVIDQYGEKYQPLFSSDPWTGEQKIKQDNPAYAGMIKSIDESLGRIIKTLKSEGIYENTIILFTSDHGGLSNRGNKRYLATSNAPLKAGKGHNYEGGIRVPHFVVWENNIEPGWNQSIVSGIDHFPTLSELISNQNNFELDGASYVPSLFDAEHADSERAIFWHSPLPRPRGTGDRASSAIRLGDYKLLDFYEDGVLELYNLKKDIGEKNNLVIDQPEKVGELNQMLDDWRKSLNVYIRPQTGLND